MLGNIVGLCLPEVWIWSKTPTGEVWDHWDHGEMWNHSVRQNMCSPSGEARRRQRKMHCGCEKRWWRRRHHCRLVSFFCKDEVQFPSLQSVLLAFIQAWDYPSTCNNRAWQCACGLSLQDFSKKSMVAVFDGKWPWAQQSFRFQVIEWDFDNRVQQSTAGNPSRFLPFLQSSCLNQRHKICCPIDW